MYLTQCILMLDADHSKSRVIAKDLKKKYSVQSFHSDNLQESFELIEKYEPDLIVVIGNFEEDVAQICSGLREKTAFYRPVIMVLSGDEAVERKIEIIKAGADDYQLDSLDRTELSFRIFAHLRRHFEELTDPITKQPARSLSYRVLKRNLEQNTGDYAIMYLDIDNFTSYNEVYGNIAADKLLQTFVAIIKTSLDEDDFLGRVGDDDFVILTSTEKAEKIAAFLSYSFDMVSEKFYTEEDAARGYLLGDEKAGARIPFVSLSMGIVSSRYKKFDNLENLMNKVMNIHRLARSKAGSFWISDRLKIAGSEAGEETKKKILIVENDAALSYLLLTTLEMQGYSVEAVGSSRGVFNSIEQNTPNLVIFDTGFNDTCEELMTCQEIKLNYPNIKLIVSTVSCSKERVLDTGADLYIPKPYELITLFNWITRFL